MATTPQTVKCLVWDLDDTLWRGTLAEGDEVLLDEAVAATVRALDERGILQSVASKNDHDAAWERLRALGLADYFVLPHIGWGAKSASVRAVADRLGFAHGAVAFVDDQAHERAEVGHHLPEVRCYPAEEAAGLADRQEFRPVRLTADARRRRAMYQEGFARDAERAAFVGPDEEFLRGLGLRMCLALADEGALARVEELTRRTSQMNATGLPYSEDDLRGLLAAPGHAVLTATLDDRLGSHGAVGVLLLERHERCWRLRLLVTSCRVVSFGAGSTLLDWLVDRAASTGMHLCADFRATERNRMMEIAYRFAGFSDERCDCLPEPSTDARLLHLRPGPRPVSSVISVEAPDVAGLLGTHPEGGDALSACAPA